MALQLMVVACARVTDGEDNLEAIRGRMSHRYLALKIFFEENGFYPVKTTDTKLMQLIDLKDETFQNFNVNGVECVLLYNSASPFPLVGKLSKHNDSTVTVLGVVEIDINGKWSAKIQK